MFVAPRLGAEIRDFRHCRCGDFRATRTAPPEPRSGSGNVVGASPGALWGPFCAVGARDPLSTTGTGLLRSGSRVGSSALGAASTRPRAAPPLTNGGARPPRRHASAPDAARARSALAPLRPNSALSILLWCLRPRFDFVYYCRLRGCGAVLFLFCFLLLLLARFALETCLLSRAAYIYLNTHNARNI